MRVFRYTGRLEGRPVSGALDGLEADGVARDLLERGIEPLTIDPEPRAGRFGWPERFAGGWPDADDLILFARQMHALTKSGVPMTRAFQGLTEGAVKPRMKNALERIADDLQSGRPLSAALTAHPRIFGPLFGRIIRVGEETGRLETAFEQLHGYLEVDKETRRRIREALRYPLFVLAAIAAALAVINFFVIPAFAGLFTRFGSELPLMTRVLLATSGFVQAHWPLLLLSPLAGGVGFALWVRDGAGRRWWDEARLRIPLTGPILREATLARFARAYALGSRSGLTAVQTLTAGEEAVDNLFLGERIRRMRERVERGESLTRAARGLDLFPPLLLQMMAVGEASGDMDGMMSEVAGYLEREVAYKTRGLSAAIEPILITVMAALVLVLALGVFLPMWDLGSAALH